MKVFLSWSGDRSNRCAQLLKEWLPNVIQALDPWMSTEDVQKGAPWLLQINQSLSQAQGIGVFCVTPENARAPWLAFEAGYLAANGGEARVCVIAIGMEVADIPSPLSLFQATKVDPEDFRRLVTSLNQQTERPLNAHVLERSFVTHWPVLEADLRELAKSQPTEPVTPKKSQQAVLAELVESNRRIENAIASLSHPSVPAQRVAASIKEASLRVPNPPWADPPAPQDSDVDWRHQLEELVSIHALAAAPSKRKRLIQIGQELLQNVKELTPADVEIITRRIARLQQPAD